MQYNVSVFCVIETNAYGILSVVGRVLIVDLVLITSRIVIVRLRNSVCRDLYYLVRRVFAFRVAFKRSARDPDILYALCVVEVQVIHGYGKSINSAYSGDHFRKIDSAYNV